MKHLKYIIIFLILNFGALALGSLLMDNGPQTEWYSQLHKAPWTPAGWVFGAAWTTIMVCFSIYMAFLYRMLKNTKVITLFAVQFVLNIGWNYVFFNKHYLGLGLLFILALTVIVGIFLLGFRKRMGLKTLWILPYFLWLFVATSLNLYILLYN